MLRLRSARQPLVMTSTTLSLTSACQTEQIVRLSVVEVRQFFPIFNLMKSYSVYILKCADDSYYTGLTNDLDRRFSEHQTGYNPGSYTQSRRPVELVFYEYFKYINQAIAFEKQVKGWSRKKKEALIERNWDRLKELAACKNDTSHKLYQKN